MRAAKRGRSPDGLCSRSLVYGLVDNLLDDGTLLAGSKHTCTLFNQGLRRRPIAPLNGPGWNIALPRQDALLQGIGQHDSTRRRDRTEVQGLFNGALRNYGDSGPFQHLVDKDGHVMASTVQDMAARQHRIGGRFLVCGEVGRGAFGVCLKGWDSGSKSFVAIKMVRRGHRHHVDAIMEAEKLQILRWRDKHHCCVRVVNLFQYHGHFCLVTELLGTNLHSALRDLRANSAGRTGVSVDAARRLSYQLCEALEFLFTSRLIHADLKAENICLAQPGVFWPPWTGPAVRDVGSRLRKKSLQRS
jgi:hypothetical protein